MKTGIFLLVSLFASTLCAQKQVTLEDFTSIGTFSQQKPHHMLPMKESDYYTTLASNRRAILKHSWETHEVVDTLFSDTVPISSYSFSPSGKKIILLSRPEKIFRRSRKQHVYVYDRHGNVLTHISKNGKVMEPLFSPDEKRIAYVRDQQLYTYTFLFKSELRVNDDSIPGVLVGHSDWLYEEEFSVTRLFCWSPDSRMLAYVCLDTRELPRYPMLIYRGANPGKNSYSDYPGIEEVTYPKAGYDNSKVSVWTYDIISRHEEPMDLGNDSDIYIPRLMWKKGYKNLLLLRLNRLQNRLDMLSVNPYTGEGTAIYTDKSARYISVSQLDNFFFTAEGDYFLTTSERDGYNHLYLYEKTGRLVEQITQGEWEVTHVYGLDEANQTVWFQSTKTSPLERTVSSKRWRNLKPKRKLLQYDMPLPCGMNSVIFSSDFNHAICSHTTLQLPTLYLAFKRDKRLRWRLADTLESNHSLRNKTREYSLPQKQFIRVPTERGDTLNGWILRPNGFDGNQTYPCLMTQYSGPGSQTVKNSWKAGWEYYLASQGYIVASIDGRGTGFRGVKFKKCTYLRLGIKETEDQISAAKYLGSFRYIDAQRIAIFGWSFGGYITLSAMTASNVFRAGVSIAPVSDWRFYDTGYTERYMRRPEDNYEGYEETSLLKRAKNLNGRLLLLHGTADDNVHVQNTLEFSEQLVQAGIDFEMMTYLNRAHSLVGGNTRHHLFSKIVHFLNRELKGDNKNIEKN